MTKIHARNQHQALFHQSHFLKYILQINDLNNGFIEKFKEKTKIQKVNFNNGLLIVDNGFNEIIISEHSKTKITAKLIVKAFSTLLLTARAGHNPNTKQNTGLSLKSPLTNSLFSFIF